MAHTRWTEYETVRARTLIADGTGDRDFQRLTGRTRDAALARLKYVDDPAFRQQRIDSSARNRSSYERKYIPRVPHQRPAPALTPAPLPTMYTRTEPAPKAPPRLIEEAQKRLAAPRSLTAWICGDPAPGYSSLDRRARA